MSEAIVNQKNQWTVILSIFDPEMEETFITRIVSEQPSDTEAHAFALKEISALSLPYTISSSVIVSQLEEEERFVRRTLVFEVVPRGEEDEDDLEDVHICLWVIPSQFSDKLI